MRLSIGDAVRSTDFAHRYDLGHTYPATGSLTAKVCHYIRGEMSESHVAIIVDQVESEIQGTLGVRTITAEIYPEDVRDAELSLPRGPVRSVTSCIDANGQDVSFELKTFGKDDRLCLKSRCAFPVTVVYEAGHDPIPGPLVRCIFAQAVEDYDNRTTNAEGPQKPWIQRTYDLYRRGSLVR